MVINYKTNVVFRPKRPYIYLFYDHDFDFINIVLVFVANLISHFEK